MSVEIWPGDTLLQWRILREEQFEEDMLGYRIKCLPLLDRQLVETDIENCGDRLDVPR